MECQVWGLERYAKLTSQNASQAAGQVGWEHFDNKIVNLEMTITPSNHLLIHHGKRQLESLSLSNAATWVKGVNKGDSLMVVMKAQDQSRRFRVKFSPSSQTSAEVNCCACIERLCKYFPVKIPESSLKNSQQVLSTPKSTPENDNVLFDDVTIGQFTDSLLAKPMQFPELYGHLGNGAQYELGTLVKLCLADPGFPAFVGRIEQELEKMKNENIL